MSSAAYSSPSFHGKFTAANVGADSPAYDHAFFLSVQDKLAEIFGERDQPWQSISLVCGILCGIKRSDLISAYFSHSTSGSPKDKTLRTYFHMREALNVVWPFVGLPNVISACYGLFDELRKLGLEPPPEVDRPALDEADWARIGDDNRRRIYQGSNNIAGIAMLEKYFPTLNYLGGNVIQGYLQDGAGKPDSLVKTELLVATAITAAGVPRQSRTHCQSALGLGCSVDRVRGVVEAAGALAAWNKTPLSIDLDIEELAAETAANVAQKEG